MDLLLWFLFLFVLVGLWLTLLWQPRPLPGVTRIAPLLIGHRGVRGSLPENTLAAFRKAFDAGLDGVEFDVQRSRDGVLVIYHDFRLHDGRKVKGLTLEQLREFEPDMPTLEELFALAHDYPGTLLNLEIKSEGARTGGLEQAVVQAVRASGLRGRVLISSFNPLSLLKVRLFAPELFTALLFAPDVPKGLRQGRLAGLLHVDALHPHHSQVTAELLRRAHARGLRVNTWTVNDSADVRRLTELGADAIMADDPAKLLQAAGRNETQARETAERMP